MDQANNPNPTRIKKVEYMSLDGLSEAEARKAAGIPSSPGPRVSPSPNWNRVVFPTTFATDEIRNKGGSGMVGDLLGVWKDAIFTGDTKQLLRNAAVRITAPAAQPKWPVKLVSRLSKGQYTLRVWGRNVDVVRYDQGDQELKTFLLAQPLNEGGDFTAQFASIGSEHFVWINGQLLGSVTDDAHGEPGLLGVQAGDGRFKSMETLSLDGLSEAEARKVAGIDPVSPSPTLPVPASNASRSDAGGAKSSAAFPPGQWTKVLTTAQEVKANSGGTKTLTMREDGWIDSMGGEPGILIVPGPYRRNQGLRLRGRVQEGGPKILGGISVRRSGLTQGVRERYHTTVNMDGEVVTYYSTEGKVSQERLQSFRAASAFPPGTEYVLEVIAIGDKLHTRINGDALPVLTDNRLESGQLAVQTTKGHLIRDVEVIYFDGLSDDEARKAAGVASSPPNAPNSSATTSPAVKAGQWIDATAEVKQNGLERNLLKVEGDWLIAKRGINYFPVSGTLELADAAVRVVFRGRVQMKLRQQPLSEKLAGYIASIGSGKSVGIGFTGPTTEKEWLKPDADLGQAYQPDEEHELVFAVHGNQLIYGMDGRLIARVEDARFQKGKIELATLMDQANNPNPTRIKKVEYMSLEGLSEAEARKAAGIGE
jgi:hypothetical protein